jgi:hypothetical protein
VHRLFISNKEYHTMSRTNQLSTYKTSIVATGDRLTVVYVATPIVEKVGNVITLDSGGWETVTTKRKMNQASNQFALGYYVFQKARKWYVNLPSGATVPFTDGMSFDRYSEGAAA